MMRRASFDEIGGYRGACEFWEDLDLYHRLGRRGRTLVLPDALYSVRFHAGSTRLVHEEERVERAVSLMLRCMRRFRESSNYESVLSETTATREHPGRNGSRPYVRYSLAASRFWSGETPGLWERLTLRDLAAPTPANMAILAFALWGAVHHQSLRTVVRSLVRARDWVAGRSLDPQRPFEWRFR
jgi:hypothetical protein